jgi:hypothetical protein
MIFQLESRLKRLVLSGFLIEKHEKWTPQYKCHFLSIFIEF